MLISNTLPGSDRSVLLHGAPMVGELQTVPAFCGPTMGIGDISYDELPLSEALGLRSDGQYKTIMVRGNSMEPQIPHGSKVFYDPLCMAQSGDIVVVSLNDALLVKQLYIESHGSPWLLSINPESSSNFRIRPNDRFQILGVYVNHVACAACMERVDIDRRIRSWYEAHEGQTLMDDEVLMETIRKLIEIRWNDNLLLLRRKRDWSYVYRAAISTDRFRDNLTYGKFLDILEHLRIDDLPSIDTLRRATIDMKGDFPDWTCPPNIHSPLEFRRLLAVARFVYERL